MLVEADMHAYQVRSVEHIIDNPAAGLFLGMGLGKTVSTLTAINRLIYEELEIASVLVIAPRRVAESVWSAEVDNWEHLKHLRVSKIIGDVKKRKAALNAKADIYMISRDNIAWLIGLYGGLFLPFNMLVIDESSSFKNHDSQRFKALKRVQPCFKRVVILTGTPAANGLINLWSQIYLLDRGDRLGKTITAYRTNYFSRSFSGFGYDIDKDADEVIHDKIKDVCISMSAADYLELPKTIINDVVIDMPPALAKDYIKFEKDLVLELFTDAEITAANAAALSTKLRQFAGGAIYDDDKNVHDLHDLKLDALEEIVEAANGDPVLIAYNFKHDAARILKRLAKYSPRALKTDDDINDWNAGRVEVMILHPASGGHGLNLQYGGHLAVWFGPTWDLELYDQFNTRLDRQGQTKPVIINRLILGETIDAEIISRLVSKDATQNKLMNAVKDRIKKYIK